MGHDEPKQLKLTGNVEGGEVKEKKEKREKEPKGNKWIVLFILIITVVISLVFYFSGNRKGELGKENQILPSLGGEKVYQF